MTLAQTPIHLTSHSYEQWAYATANRLLALGCSRAYADEAGQQILDRAQLKGSREA